MENEIYFDDIESSYYKKEAGFFLKFEADNSAFIELLPEKRIKVKIQTDKAINEVIFVYNDGLANGVKMDLYQKDSSVNYWETIILPKRDLIRYSFAMKDKNKKIYYLTKRGLTDKVTPLERWEYNIKEHDIFKTPDWVKGSIIYQIFPDRFANNNSKSLWNESPEWFKIQGGNLFGIIERMDYIIDLGVDIIYLNPINTSPSPHKYDAVDFLNVDPILGGNDAFNALIEKAHDNGIKVIIDISLNHCHPNFFAFKDIIENGKKSEYFDWFTIYDYPIKIKYRAEYLQKVNPDNFDQLNIWINQLCADTGIILEESKDEGNIFELNYLSYFNNPNMPKINLKNFKAREYFLNVGAHWLKEFKVDGLRMDVVRHIDHDFWQEFRIKTKSINPDCYLLAEVWEDSTPWLQGDQFDANMNYIFRNLCLEYFGNKSISTTKFIDDITKMLSLYSKEASQVTHNLLGSHDVERFLFSCKENKKSLYLAYFFLLTMPGCPGIYYGDEIGMSGGNDPDNRRTFLWNDPDKWDFTILEMIKNISKLRKSYKSLRYGDWKSILTKEEILIFERAYDKEKIWIIITRDFKKNQFKINTELTSIYKLFGTSEYLLKDNRFNINNLKPWSGEIIKAIYEKE